VAEALVGQAEGALALGQPGSALPLLAQALQLAEQARAQPVCALAHEALSRAHEAAGDLAAALHHHRAFHACERQRFNPPGQRRLRQFLQQQALASAHHDVQAERQRSAELAQALEEARRAEQSRSELLAELQAQAELLQQLARVDGLTGVANRRWLDLQLLRETERAHRFGHPLAVAMVDVDHFKAVNDGLSHAVGDAVLRQLAGLLRSGCRASDVVGRYGGEEFVLILVETTQAQALEACEKLRERVAAHAWGAVHPALPGLSVSIGVAGFDADAPQDNLLERADQALYRAKNGGRNRVCG
jgi:diguanylate cyclase (GGDEF)-like protein